MIRILVPLSGALLLGSCAAIIGSAGEGTLEGDLSLYEEVRFRAEAGDDVSQTFLGYMLFFGEHAPLARQTAADWFRRAASQGNASANANLAIMHYLGVGVPRDTLLATEYLEAVRMAGPSTLPLGSVGELALSACEAPRPRTTPGEQIYDRFCAGCHGWNGIATYRGSPSFALGERLEQSDDKLFSSILGGHGDMPSWGDKFPAEWLRETITVLRAFQGEFRQGLIHRLREPPQRYFRFGVLGSDWAARPHQPSLAYGGGVPASPDFCAPFMNLIAGDGMRPDYTAAGLVLALGVAVGDGAAQEMLIPDSLPPGVTVEMVLEGKELFEGRGLCYTCHGAQAGGSIGPNLTNPGWWYAEGSYLAIIRQILVGVPEAQSTVGVAMPPMGGADMAEDDVQAVAAYVWRVSHPSVTDSLPPGVTDLMVARGDRVFHGPGRCYTCHGNDATGSVGPNLTDDEWLHVKGSYLTILQQILIGVPSSRSRSGIEMPPRGGAPLSDAQVQSVAAYVWALSRSR